MCLEPRRREEREKEREKMILFDTLAQAAIGGLPIFRSTHDIPHHGSQYPVLPHLALLGPAALSFLLASRFVVG